MDNLLVHDTDSQCLFDVNVEVVNKSDSDGTRKVFANLTENEDDVPDRVIRILALIDDVVEKIQNLQRRQASDCVDILPPRGRGRGGTRRTVGSDGRYD